METEIKRLVRETGKFIKRTNTVVGTANGLIRQGRRTTANIGKMAHTADRAINRAERAFNKAKTPEAKIMLVAAGVFAAGAVIGAIVASMDEDKPAPPRNKHDRSSRN